MPRIVIPKSVPKRAPGASLKAPPAGTRLKPPPSSVAKVPSTATSSFTPAKPAVAAAPKPVSSRMGVELASPALLDAMRKHGRVIQIAKPGSEELRYLEYMNAEANVGGPNLSHILLRQMPSKPAILEEFLHGTQARLGLLEKHGQQRCEVHVKDFLIRHSALLDLQGPDVKILQELLEAEKELLGRLEGHR